MESEFTIKDNSVYFDGNKLKSISSEQFQPITYTNQYNQTYVRCLKDKKGIWFFHSRGKGIVTFLTDDIANFQFIDDDYARDSKHVFLVAKGGFIIPNADVDTFKVITETPYFAKDKNQLYALDSISGLSVYRYADFDSIVNGDWGQFVTDKHNLYHYDVDINIANDQKYLNYLDDSSFFEKGKGKSIFEANKEFFLKRYPSLIGWWHKEYPFQIDIESISQLGFYKTKNAVFYLESNSHLKHSVPTFLQHADCPTFKKLNDYYGMDKNTVFFKSIPVLDVAIKTFKLINNQLAKDKNNYYYNGNKIACDYQSFGAVDDNTIFYKDKNTLFSVQQIREGKVGFRYEIITTLVPIKKSSPNTFEAFSTIWAKDNKQVYRYGEPFKKADASTFEYLHIKARYDWAKDKNHLYNSSVKKIIKGINGATFQALNKFWGKDENNVVFFPTEGIRPSIDSSTFQITDDIGGAIDKNYLYSVGDSTELKKNKR